MSSSKDSPSEDLAALAAEACDLWQEHIATYANDPKAKAELMRLLEPSRRMFADWSLMMQNAAHGIRGPSSEQAPTAKSNAAPGPKTARPPSDDGSLRLAQLTDHMALLEQRLARLEAGLEGALTKAARQTKRAKPRS